MNSLDDFASCGFCGKVVYVMRITAPPKWHQEDVRAKIGRTGEGPGICPECGKDSRFMTRRRAAEIEEQRKSEEAQNATEV
jgi:hypothetical protein